MYFIGLISLVLTFQAVAAQATCNKTLQKASLPSFPSPSPPETNSNIHSQLEHQQHQQKQTSQTNPHTHHDDDHHHHHHERHRRRLYNNSTTTESKESMHQNQTAATPTTNISNPIGPTTTPTPFRSGPVDGIGPVDFRSFRLEYNKFKILSNLGITANIDELEPKSIDEDLRKKLTATSEFADNVYNLASSSTSRHKRSLSCDQVNGNKNACCLENFYVNFTYIGWDKWILYPAGYNANYCHGQCDLSHARYYHSTLLSKYSNVVSLCCSPKHMAPLRLLYIDEDNKVHQKSIPDMIVESCDCA